MGILTQKPFLTPSSFFIFFSFYFSSFFSILFCAIKRWLPSRRRRLRSSSFAGFRFLHPHQSFANVTKYALRLYHLRNCWREKQLGKNLSMMTAAPIVQMFATATNGANSVTGVVAATLADMDQPPYALLIARSAKRKTARQ